MNIEMMRAFHAGNSWATRQVLTAAARVDDAIWSAAGVDNQRSLRETLVHLVGTQRAWLGWWDGSLTDAEAYTLFLDPQDYPSADALLLEWEAIDAATAAFLETLAGDDLTRDFVMRVPGREATLPLWQMLLHVGTHDAQHRGEAALMLTEAGASPGGLDLLWYFLQTGAPGGAS
ncbi:MAG: DinB family protein [Thermomicrobiales bacterium]